MSKKLYNTLGVDENATAKEIKDAFKQKAKDNHPDKGGDEEKMKEYNHAYAVLINPDKRKKYDETGDERAENSFESRFLSIVSAIFIQLIEKNSIQNVKVKDLIKEFKLQVNGTIKQLDNMLNDLDDRRDKYIESLNRVSSKKSNAITTILQGQIDAITQQQEGMKQEQEFLKLCLVEIEDYTYKTDEPEPRREEIRKSKRSYTTAWFESVVAEEETKNDDKD
jgi:DnaJ-class molecular chaperone